MTVLKLEDIKNNKIISIIKDEVHILTNYERDVIGRNNHHFFTTITEQREKDIIKKLQPKDTEIFWIYIDDEDDDIIIIELNKYDGSYFESDCRINLYLDQTSMTRQKMKEYIKRFTGVELEIK